MEDQDDAAFMTEEASRIEELERARQEYLYAFKQLKENDPCCRTLSLSFNWKKTLMRSDIDLFLEALVFGGRFLRELSVNTRVIDYDNELSVLRDFVATSTQLEHLEIIQASNRRVEEAEMVNELLDAVKQSDCVKGLLLKSIRFVKGNALPRLLAKTTSLKNLTINYCTVDSLDTGEELLCSLGDNSSLERLTFQTLERKLRLCALIHGMYEHEGLRQVRIHVNHCTRDECELLARYIQSNRTLEHLSFSVSRPRINPDLNLASILQGVQNNHTLKHLRLRVDDPVPCRDAWRKMLAHNKTLEELDLRTFKLADENVHGIALGMTTNTSIKSLNLAYCLYNAWEAQAAAFHAEIWRDMLLKNNTLENLNLRGGKIGDQGIQILSQGLRHNFSVQVLDLADNSITTTGFHTIIEALNTNIRLKTLDVGFNEIGHGSLVNLLRHTSVKHFDFTCNQGGGWLDNDAFTSSLSENTVLDKLVMEDINLSEFRAQALWDGLRYNTSVRTLSLVNNRMTLASYGHRFTRMLHENGHLVTLDISLCNAIGNEGMQALARGLVRNQCLQRLLANAISLDDETLCMLGEALQENTTLKYLAWTESASSLTDQGIRDFFRLLVGMKGLKELRFGDLFSLTEETGLVLVESLQENTEIETIHVKMHSLDSLTRQLIEFYLELNRRSRRWIERKTSSSGIDRMLWPWILAKLSSPEDLRYMSYFLHQKLELLIHRPSQR